MNRRQWLRLQMPLVHLTASPLVSKASQLHPNHDHLPLQESVCQASSISGLHLKTSQRGDQKTQVQENSLSLLLGTLVGHMAPLPATASQLHTDFEHSFSKNEKNKRGLIFQIPKTMILNRGKILVKNIPASGCAVNLCCPKPSRR